MDDYTRLNVKYDSSLKRLIGLFGQGKNLKYRNLDIFFLLRLKKAVLGASIVSIVVLQALPLVEWAPSAIPVYILQGQTLVSALLRATETMAINSFGLCTAVLERSR
ncbi:hypothetical protein HNY73_010749 [Argiope bruennichi]|uniref:Uncharacterized protein n=1 Tax=Argiope bruennichi TaxID=94029 RepID=A0A8T0F4H1_ARGBR|nr:hypothetical protein HNY73_010749 [Argiope bruennichi]